MQSILDSFWIKKQEKDWKIETKNSKFYFEAIYKLAMYSNRPSNNIFILIVGAFLSDIHLWDKLRLHIHVMDHTFLYIVSIYLKTSHIKPFARPRIMINFDSDRNRPAMTNTSFLHFGATCI